MVRFGDCLCQLVAKYGWTRSELVKALENRGIDRSLVYRWFRNERVPGLRSGHCERIADCFQLSQEDFNLLVQAQIESLRLQVGRPIAAHPLIADQMPADGSKTGKYMQSIGLPTELAEHPGQTKSRVVWEEDEMLHNAIAMLEAAGEPTTDAREILFTSQGEGYPYMGIHLDCWLSAVRSALDKGFDFVHILRLNGNATLSMQLVESILRLTGAAGRYHPHYFAGYGTEVRPYDLLIVPRVAVCSYFATERLNRLGAALSTYDPQEIALLQAHFAVLKAQTMPLYRSRWGYGEMRAQLMAVTETEEQEGDLLAVSLKLSPHTEPFSWHDRLADREEVTPGHLRAAIELRRRRLNAFYRQVEDYHFHEICPKSAVVRMVRTVDVTSIEPWARISPEDCIEHLENIVALLNSFDNYELALLNEEEERRLLSRCSWEVKWDIGGNPRVHIEAGAEVANGLVVYDGIEIVEPTVVSAFRRYFTELFDRMISHLSKDKREVVAFLNAQISWLRRRMKG